VQFHINPGCSAIAFTGFSVHLLPSGSIAEDSRVRISRDNRLSVENLDIQSGSLLDNPKQQRLELASKTISSPEGALE
jgi:hypothetical protein